MKMFETILWFHRNQIMETDKLVRETILWSRTSLCGTIYMEPHSLLYETILWKLTHNGFIQWKLTHSTVLVTYNFI